MEWTGTLRRTSLELVQWERPPNEEEVSQQVKRTWKIWRLVGFLHALAVGFFFTGWSSGEEAQSLAKIGLITLGVHIVLALICWNFIRQLCRAWLERKDARRWAHLSRAWDVRLTLEEPSAGTPGRLLAERAAGEGEEVAREYLPLDASPPKEKAPPPQWKRSEVALDDGRFALDLVSDTDGGAVLEIRDAQTRQRIDLQVEAEPSDVRPRIDRDPVVLSPEHLQAFQQKLLPLCEALDVQAPHGWKR